MAIHDLRTPVTAIKGFGQLTLRRRDLPPDLRQHLETIVAEANRAAGYLEDLALLSRLEDGEDLVQARSVNLGGVVDVALAQVGRGPLSPAVAPLEGPDLAVRCDPSLTARAIFHLLRLAHKHAGDEPIRISTTRRADGPALLVAARAVAGAESELDELVSIRQNSSRHGRNGPGGRKVERQRENGLAPENGCLDLTGAGEIDLGTRGLGLHIASKLVESQGATLWIDLPAAGGACFYVVFPEG